jgi:hypothetical protein
MTSQSLDEPMMTPTSGEPAEDEEVIAEPWE